GPIGELAVRTIDDEDWLAAWKASLAPIRVGAFLVRPTWSDADAAGAIALALDPGMAFGTGLHPTTQQCLEALSTLPVEGLRVLDVGTGSGILAIAAAKRGAREVVAVDVDPLAVAAAAEIAEHPVLRGPQAHQIANVLRLRENEVITLVRDGIEAKVQLCEVTGEEVRGRVIGRCPAETEPPFRLTLALPLLKGDHDEEVV